MNKGKTGSMLGAVADALTHTHTHTHTHTNGYLSISNRHLSTLTAAC